MPIISRREIEIVVAEFLDLSHEHSRGSRKQVTRRVIAEDILAQLLASGAAQPHREINEQRNNEQRMNEVVVKSFRGPTAPAIKGRALLPENAAGTCMVGMPVFRCTQN